jgi:hypothetical protein
VGIIRGQCVSLEVQRFFQLIAMEHIREIANAQWPHSIVTEPLPSRHILPSTSSLLSRATTVQVFPLFSFLSNAKLGRRNVNAADRLTAEFLSLGGVQDVSHERYCFLESRGCSKWKEISRIRDLQTSGA